MTIKSPDELFESFLKNVFYAENTVFKELPKLAKRSAAKTLQFASA